MQVVPLRLLTPHDTQEFSLDLVKNTNPNDPQNKKQRGQLVVQMTFNPFKEDNERFSGPLDRHASNQSSVGRLPKHDGSICGSGLLSVLIRKAEDVEGKYHNNPYAMIVFKGEKKRTKVNFYKFPLKLLFPNSLHCFTSMRGFDRDIIPIYRHENMEHHKAERQGFHFL